MGNTYDTEAEGIRILPGCWRPHYPWEHIAWISPPWPGQDYVWLDFPEAIFTSQGLIFLSHINPGVPSVYTDLPKVTWQAAPNGLCCERRLPNGVVFGGELTRADEGAVKLRLHLENGTDAPLNNISLQTCVFLRACREFADFSLDNKFVHVPAKGWMPYPEAKALGAENGQISLGWRRGPRTADWPVMAVMSNQAPRLLAMTWHDHTLSLVGNPNHPCLHADPFMPDLAPGQRAEIRGTLLFLEGTLDSLSSAFAPA